LKAHRVVIVVRLATSVDVRHIRLADNHGFDNDVLDLVHNSICICALLIQKLQDGVKTSLMPRFLFPAFLFRRFLFAVSLFASLILLKGSIVFIDGIICKMHKQTV